MFTLLTLYLIVFIEYFLLLKKLTDFFLFISFYNISNKGINIICDYFSFFTFKFKNFSTFLQCFNFDYFSLF